jgi:hypothetical protein
MQGAGPLISRRDQPASAGLACLVPTTADAMVPRTVTPAAAAELLGLTGEYAMAEKLERKGQMYH